LRVNIRELKNGIDNFGSSSIAAAVVQKFRGFLNEDRIGNKIAP